MPWLASPFLISPLLIHPCFLEQPNSLLTFSGTGQLYLVSPDKYYFTANRLLEMTALHLVPLNFNRGDKAPSRLHPNHVTSREHGECGTFVFFPGCS